MADFSLWPPAALGRFLPVATGKKRPEAGVGGGLGDERALTSSQGHPFQ